MDIKVSEVEKALLDNGVDTSLGVFDVEDSITVLKISGTDLSLGRIFSEEDELIFDGDDLNLYTGETYYGSFFASTVEEVLSELYFIAGAEGLTLG